MQKFLFGTVHEPFFKPRDHVEESLENTMLPTFLGCEMFLRSIRKFHFPQHPICQERVDATESVDGAAEMAPVVD
jgi:hypothetical protein